MTTTISRPMRSTASTGMFLAALLAAGLAIVAIGLVASRTTTTTPATTVKAEPAPVPFNDSLEDYKVYQPAPAAPFAIHPSQDSSQFDVSRYVYGIGLPAVTTGPVLNPTFGTDANKFLTGSGSASVPFNDSLEEYSKYSTGAVSATSFFNDSLEEYEQYAGSAGGGGRTGRIAN
jgi:hypothetical protein